MVTTDEDNVVRGTITEADRFGNVRTYVEVGVEKVEEVVTGDSRRPSPAYPLMLLLISVIFILLGHGYAALPLLFFLTVWTVGVTR